jgi:hypothetical protein
LLPVRLPIAFWTVPVMDSVYDWSVEGPLSLLDMMVVFLFALQR